MRALVLLVIASLLAFPALAEGERTVEKRYTTTVETPSCSTSDNDVGVRAACFTVVKGETRAVLSMVDDYLGPRPAEWHADGDSGVVHSGRFCGSGTATFPADVVFLVVWIDDTPRALLECSDLTVGTAIAGTVTASFS